ncbi:MAG: hypothetical protein KF764_09235 [Labilithrix sp.]|nr:hypothetical protein [Labilithrix sp.]MBX3225175.1 hypothetical protein [Labilithrix sp.]
MLKSNAANVIDLEAFRQRKLVREERPSDAMPMASGAAAHAVMVPVWFCWVPMWTPIVG